MQKVKGTLLMTKNQKQQKQLVLCQSVPSPSAHPPQSKDIHKTLCISTWIILSRVDPYKA